MTSDKEKELTGANGEPKREPKGEKDKELDGLFGEAPSFKLSWEDPGPTTQRFKISDLPREVRYSLKHTSKLSLSIGIIIGIFIFAGTFYLLKRKSPVPLQMMAVEEKVLLPLPSDLKSTLCSAVLWEGEVRPELLSSQDQSVQLRVYDCLQLLKAHGLRDRYGKKLVFSDFNIYRNIIHVLFGEASVPGSFGDCSKAPKTQTCLADLFSFRTKGNRAKLKSELVKAPGDTGLRSTLVELLRAEQAFREGNFPLFRKSILSSVQACPRNLTGLRSEILSWAQIRLLMGGNVTEAANFANINLKILDREDKNTSWKARYLAQYAAPGTKEKLIQHAFSKTGVIQLVKSPELLSVIVPEAVKLKMAPEILGRFDLVRDFQSLEGVSQRNSAEKVILWKARVLLSLKKYQEVEVLLASWLKSSSSVSGEFWYVRGLANIKLEQLKSAQSYFQKARQGGLSHWALLWNLGYVAAKLGQASQASEFVAEALKDVGGARGERQAWMQLVLGESALRQNKGASSVALTRRFLNSFPTDPAGWELLARALKKMGKRAESVKAGMKLDELEAQLRYYLTDRYLFAPNGPFSGLP